MTYIGLILVRREHQKQGVGRGLLTFLESVLLAQGIDRLYSSSQVNESEPQAWHRHVGFEKCGIINGIYEGNIGEVFKDEHHNYTRYIDYEGFLNKYRSYSDHLYVLGYYLHLIAEI